MSTRDVLEILLCTQASDVPRSISGVRLRFEVDPRRLGSRPDSSVAIDDDDRPAWTDDDPIADADEG
jgi:hypothetical protein